MEILSPDFLLDGKYLIKNLVGEGGLGRVYRAEQAELNRVVAIKVLESSKVEEAEQRARFEREARILSTLVHRNIVAIYNFGLLPNHCPYMAMEFLEGRTLSEMIKSGDTRNWKRSARIGKQICLALAAAHESGIIHRDLKPQNVIILSAPEPDFVKVLDFGLSKIIAGDSSSDFQRLTQTGALMGSIHYMSPEVCAGQKADARSDIYALGCILYECLTGQPPLDSENPIGLLHKHRTELPERLSNRADLKELPRAFEAVIFKAIQKDPNDRFQNMIEFGQQLDLIINEKFKEVSAENVRFDNQTKRSSKPLLLMGALAALAMILVAAASIFLASQKEKASRETAALTEHTHAGESRNAVIRLAEYKKARLLLEKGTVAKNNGDLRTAAQYANRSLRIITQTFAKNSYTMESALEEAALIHSLVALYEGLHPKQISQFDKAVGTTVLNSGKLLGSVPFADAISDFARIQLIHGASWSAIGHFHEAALIYARHSLPEKMKEQIRMIKEIKKNTSPSSSEYAVISCIYDLALAKQLFIDGKRSEARKLTREAADLLENNVGGSVNMRLSATLALFELEQDVGDPHGAQTLDSLLIDAAQNARARTELESRGVKLSSNERRWKNALGTLEHIENICTVPAYRKKAQRILAEIRDAGPAPE